MTHTWTNYTNAGGTEGPTIPSNARSRSPAALTGFRVADGNTWWYRIASSALERAYYASADAFYNNGQTSGSLPARRSSTLRSLAAEPGRALGRPDFVSAL